MTENCPFLPADETRAPVWPAAARFHAFEWLSALATTDGAPEEAGIALDTWHNTAMDLQDVKAGVVPQAIARAAFNSLDKDGFRAFVNDCKKAGFTVEFPICDATPQPLIERHIAAGQQGASIASQWWKRADEMSENDPISRRHAMTLRQCATELAEHLATPKPPKPAGAVPQFRCPMNIAPRDGSVVILHWGEDHSSPGWWSAPEAPVKNDDGTYPDGTIGWFPWSFIDWDCGRPFVNKAVETEYGPTGWSVYGITDKTKHAREAAGRADAAPASKWFGPDKDGEMYVQTGDRWWKARPTTVGGAGRFPSDAAAEEFIDRHKHLIGGAEND